MRKLEAYATVPTGGTPVQLPVTGQRLLDNPSQTRSGSPQLGVTGFLFGDGKDFFQEVAGVGPGRPATGGLTLGLL